MLPGKKLTVADYLNMARRRVWLILVPPVLTLFGALVYSSTVPNVYQSDMLIAIDPQRVPDAFVRSTVTLATEQRMDAISVKVLSRTNLLSMIEELGLYDEMRARLPIEDVVTHMRANIDVQLERGRPNPRGPETYSAFHVRFTYTDPNIAAQVTQQLGSLFVQQNTQDRGALAQSTNVFLESQLKEARTLLEAQERRLEAFRERHGKALPTQIQSNMQAIANAQLQVQGLVESMARDKDRKLMLERLYRDAVNEPPPPAPPTPVQGAAATGNGGPTVGSAQQQLVAARATLAGLEQKYKADHPDVVRTRRLVAELEPKAAAEAAAATTATATAGGVPADPARRESLRQMLAEIESLDRQTTFKETEERRLRAEIADYQVRIESVPGLESEWASLTRDYDTQQTAYKDLLTKSGAAKLAVDLEQQQIGELFRIVDPAGVPVRPLRSLRLQINAGGLVLGLLFGLGLAALLEVKDSSFRTDSDVLEALELPVLASVPFIESASDRTRGRRRRLMLSFAGAVCLAGMCYMTWTLQLWKGLI
jgi:polysaccharide chain length determinant protein (PEP-CTERM system associated)